MQGSGLQSCTAGAWGLTSKGERRAGHSNSAVASSRKTAFSRQGLGGAQVFASSQQCCSLGKFLRVLPREGQGPALAQVPGCSEKGPAMT